MAPCRLVEAVAPYSPTMHIVPPPFGCSVLQAAGGAKHFQTLLAAKNEQIFGQGLASKHTTLAVTTNAIVCACPVVCFECACRFSRRSCACRTCAC